MIYLASPYSHPDPAVKEARFQAACRASALLMSQGEHVFSPISHTHPVKVAGDLRGEWDFWERYDRWFIERCDEVVVLMLGGWEESIGVNAELEIARNLGKPIWYWSGENMPGSWELTKEIRRRKQLECHRP